MILSSSLSLPRTAVTETFAILAMRGAGKTNAARVMAEGMHADGLPFVAIDPVGSWWGLRAGRDGEPGLPVPIFGGRHGDVPLERGGGVVVADAIIEGRLSCVIDLSEFESEAAKKQFLVDFARRLYAKNREPLHLFLEEADDYIPQRATAGELQLLRAWENIVRRGRARGLGMTLITQRSAVLAKNVLTQIGTLFAMRTTSPQDRAAIEAWVRYNASDEKDEILGSLPKLGSGEAWVWSPHFLGRTERIKFNLSKTFDSGATPKMARGKKPAATLADVDLEGIRKRMAETIERAKADDPKELREALRVAQARNAQLAKQIGGREAQLACQASDLTALLRRIEDSCRALQKLGEEIAGAAPAERTITVTDPSIDPSTVMRIAGPTVRARLLPTGGSPAVTVGPASHSREVPVKVETIMSKGPRTVLIAIAQHEAGVTREQLTTLTGYKRSSRDTYLQLLRQNGLIEVSDNRIQATSAGVRALGDDYEPLPKGSALRAHWLSRLPAGEKRVFEVVLGAAPNGTTVERIDAASGYKRSSRDTYLQRLVSRALVVRRGREVFAAPALFD